MAVVAPLINDKVIWNVPVAPAGKALMKVQLIVPVVPEAGVMHVKGKSMDGVTLRKPVFGGIWNSTYAPDCADDPGLENCKVYCSVF